MTEKQLKKWLKEEVLADKNSKSKKKAIEKAKRAKKKKLNKDLKACFYEESHKTVYHKPGKYNVQAPSIFGWWYKQDS